MKNKINPCPECGQHFDNIFEATDHLLEEEEEFDPALILPNGYRLMIGSLLRCMYKYAEEPEQIRSITQDTYLTLFTAETDPDTVISVVEDMIVDSSMVGIDDELKQLLENGE
jgi:predicted amidophosphoribosyltransferase